MRSYRYPLLVIGVDGANNLLRSVVFVNPKLDQNRLHGTGVSRAENVLAMLDVRLRIVDERLFALMQDKYVGC
jgi:hypothetical protein